MSIKINISSRPSGFVVGKILSNLYDYCIIVIDGIPYSSIEILLQMIKFPPGSPEREEIISLSGKNAGIKVKRIGGKAEGKYVY